MLKKTITYEDFNEETQTEDFYFHLSVAELTEMELSHKDGLSDYLKAIVVAEDGKGIVEIFQNIILKAYGQKSDDGRRFIKTQELCDEFMQTGAYSVMFLELVTNTDAAVEFIRGLMPKDMAKKVDEALVNKASLSVVAEEEAVVRTITSKELEALGDQDKAQAYIDLSSGRLKLVAMSSEEESQLRKVTRADLVAMSSEEESQLRKDILEGKAEIAPEPFTS